jgi:predicted amidohydrolase
MKPGLRLALIQMRVEGGDPAANLARAEASIAEAAAAGADLALLPEAIDVGWTHPSVARLAGPIPDGETCRRLAAAAQRHRLFVCAGLTERDGERIFNSAVILDRQGRLLLLHRKLNELEIGHDCYAQGDRLGVCHTELGALGLMICADGFARGQVLSRALGYMGADVILSPCAWAVPADHDNTRTPYGQEWLDCYVPVARAFSVWIVGLSNVGWLTAGPWSGRPCIGNSLVIGPDGQVALQCPYGVDADTIRYIEITPRPRPARGDGWIRIWQKP